MIYIFLIKYFCHHVQTFQNMIFPHVEFGHNHGQSQGFSFFEAIKNFLLFIAW